MDVVLLLKGRSSRHCRANAPYSNTYTPQYLPLEANQNHHYQDKNIIHLVKFTTTTSTKMFFVIHEQFILYDL